MEAFFGFVASQPELLTTLVAAFIAALGVVGKKYTKFKKYSDVLVTAIETAKDSKEVKRIVSDLADKDKKVNTSDFVGFVKEVVQKV